MFLFYLIAINTAIFILCGTKNPNDSLFRLLLLQPVLLSLACGFLMRCLVPLRSYWVEKADIYASRFLSIALSFLGAQFVFADLFALSWRTFSNILIAIAATCFIGCLINSFLKIRHSMMIWLLVGNCICGPTAISFAAQIFQGEKKDIAKAIWINTLTGFVLMILLPFFATTLHLDPSNFGLWAGASLQSTAQVITSASLYSNESSDIALLIKSFRILLLLPLVFTLQLLSSNNSKKGQVSSPLMPNSKMMAFRGFLQTFPLFIFGFSLIAVVYAFVDLFSASYSDNNILIELLLELKPILSSISKYCLAAAMFAIGFLCRFELNKNDIKNICFAIFSSLVLVGSSFFLINN